MTSPIHRPFGRCICRVCIKYRLGKLRRERAKRELWAARSREPWRGFTLTDEELAEWPR